MIEPKVQRKLYITGLWLTGGWAVYSIVHTWRRLNRYGGTENDLMNFASLTVPTIPLTLHANHILVVLPF